MKVIESVATDWRKIGALLDFDPAGKRLGIIAATEKDRPEDCCQSMFQHWLKGNGLPATWTTLIRVLEDCELNAVALEVKTALQMVAGVWNYCVFMCIIRST